MAEKAALPPGIFLISLRPDACRAKKSPENDLFSLYMLP
jgi:hypothetical protein